MNNDFLNKYKKSNEEIENTQIDGFEDVDSTPKSSMVYQQKNTFDPPKHVSLTKTQKKFPIIYPVIGVVVIVISVALVCFLSRGTKLPNLEGWTVGDAQLWADENNVLVRSEKIYDDTIPLDTVISQFPQEGEHVKRGNFVELTVSSGPDYSVMVEVPDLMSMTMSEVEEWATENHMSTVRITTEESETVEEGKAIKFSINDNTVVSKEVRRDTPIYVVFSKGVGQGEAITLPDFTMMTVDEAKEYAEENELTLNIIEEFSDNVMINMVIKQDIKAEQVVYESDIITLTVSLGTEIIVPNFSEYSKEIALAKASQLGIMYVVEEKYSSSKIDKFISQSIKSGTLYNEEDVLTLTYSLGNEFVLDSFVGQSEESLKSWISPLNEQGASLKISTTYTSSQSPAGTILSQDIENQTIGISKTIKIVVSSGNIIYVPDFVGVSGSSYGDIVTREDVISICDELQLVPIFVAENKEGKLPGEVWYQSLSAGKEVQQGTSITIKYVPVSTTYSVPNFNGMTKDEIISSGYDKQFTIYYELGEYVENMDGKITTQSVKSGSTVAPGTAITLTICGENMSPQDDAYITDSATDAVV